MLFKEFRAQLRGSRAALLLSVYVGLALIAMRLVYNAVASGIEIGEPIFNTQIGQAIFIGLVMALQALTVFLAPATTVNSISSEHERRTFDLLLTTPLSPTQLLLGKLIVALAFLGLLLLGALPLFSIVVMFGGVSAPEIGRAGVTIVLSALAGCMLGLLCSAITRQTYSATLLCYALLVALIGGTIFLANLWSASNSALPAPPYYLFANPLTAAASALARTRPPEIISNETLQPLIVLSLLTQGTITLDQNERAVLPIYRASWMLYIGASLIMFWLCLHLVQPRRRRAFGRGDMVMAALLLIFLALALLTSSWWGAGLTTAAG
jgi:ABC-type transport system involved in multi-copper enzyme maturation permease subunit